MEDGEVREVLSPTTTRSRTRYGRFEPSDYARRLEDEEESEVSGTAKCSITSTGTPVKIDDRIRVKREQPMEFVRGQAVWMRAQRTITYDENILQSIEEIYDGPFIIRRKLKNDMYEVNNVMGDMVGVVETVRLQPFTEIDSAMEERIVAEFYEADKEKRETDDGKIRITCMDWLCSFPYDVSVTEGVSGVTCGEVRDYGQRPESMTGAKEIGEGRDRMDGRKMIKEYRQKEEVESRIVKEEKTTSEGKELMDLEILLVDSESESEEEKSLSPLQCVLASFTSPDLRCL